MSKHSWVTGLLLISLLFIPFSKPHAQGVVDPFDVQKIPPLHPKALEPHPAFPRSAPSEPLPKPQIVLPNEDRAFSSKQPVKNEITSETTRSQPVPVSTQPTTGREGGVWDWIVTLFENEARDQDFPEERPGGNSVPETPSTPVEKETVQQLDPFLDARALPLSPVQIHPPAPPQDENNLITQFVTLLEGDQKLVASLPEHTYSAPFERTRPVAERLAQTEQTRRAVNQQKSISNPEPQLSQNQSVLHNIVEKNRPDAGAVATDKAPPSREPVDLAIEITPAKETEEAPGFFERLGRLFRTSDPKEPLIDPEQNLALLSSEAPSEKPAIPKVSQKLPLTVVITKPAPAPLDPRLEQAVLGMGLDIQLGQAHYDLNEKARCFTKNRGSVSFCLTQTRWPDGITPYFNVTTHLYLGTQAIVKYDGDIATRLFALFETQGFGDIVAHFETQLGPATQSYTRKTRTIKRGIVDNPVVLWRRKNPDDGLFEVIEIRKIADMRGSIPDLQRGAVRVYFEGAREIFSMTSDLDYMQLR